MFWIVLFAIDLEASHTPEPVQDEENVICHDPVRPTLVQFVLEIIARY